MKKEETERLFEAFLRLLAVLGASIICGLVMGWSAKMVIEAYLNM